MRLLIAIGAARRKVQVGGDPQAAGTPAPDEGGRLWQIDRGLNREPETRLASALADDGKEIRMFRISLPNELTR